MTAQLLAAPYSYFTDANNNPLAGGLIYTYASGTDTAQDSYTDYTAGTPAANPVELDSEGKAQIWLQGTYRIKVKTSAGVLLRTADHVTATSAATGDMTAAVYDAAGVMEQLLGKTAVQTGITNKTFVDPVVGTQTAFNNSTKAASTAYVDAAAPQALTSYTPTVAASSGSITTSSATGSYQKISPKLCWFNAIATITTNGSGSGTLRVGLPFAAVTETFQSVQGYENAISGKSVNGNIAATLQYAACTFYDGTYPAADGARVIVTGFFRYA